MQRFRGGLVFKAHRLAHHSTLGLRVINKKTLRGGRTRRRSEGRTVTTGRELMAPRTDRTTRIPSVVASPVTTNHAANGSVFVNLRNGGNLKRDLGEVAEEDEQDDNLREEQHHRPPLCLVEVLERLEDRLDEVLVLR